MPDSAAYRGDGTMTSRFIDKEKSDESIASAMDKARLSSTAGSGLGAKGKALTGAPKQEPGESPSAYGDRMRKYRESQIQQKAFSK